MKDSFELWFGDAASESLPLVGEDYRECECCLMHTRSKSLKYG